MNHKSPPKMSSVNPLNPEPFQETFGFAPTNSANLKIGKVYAFRGEEMRTCPSYDSPMVCYRIQSPEKLTSASGKEAVLKCLWGDFIRINDQSCLFRCSIPLVGRIVEYDEIDGEAIIKEFDEKLAPQREAILQEKRKQLESKKRVLEEEEEKVNKRRKELEEELRALEKETKS